MLCTQGYTLATLLAILVLSLEGTSAQAPGDESTCAIQEDQPNRRVLMESKYYADLLPGTIGGSPVWTALDEDNDGKTVRVVNKLLLIALSLLISFSHSGAQALVGSVREQ